MVERTGTPYRSICSYRKLPPPACPGTTCISLRAFHGEHLDGARRAFDRITCCVFVISFWGVRDICLQYAAEKGLTRATSIIDNANTNATIINYLTLKKSPTTKTHEGIGCR